MLKLLSSLASETTLRPTAIAALASMVPRGEFIAPLLASFVSIAGLFPELGLSLDRECFVGVGVRSRGWNSIAGGVDSWRSRFVAVVVVGGGEWRRVEEAGSGDDCLMVVLGFCPRSWFFVLCGLVR